MPRIRLPATLWGVAFRAFGQSPPGSTRRTRPPRRTTRLLLWQISRIVAVMMVTVHVTSGTPVEELSHDAQVLRSVLGTLRSAEGRSVVGELIAGLLADGVVLARVHDVVTPREAGELLGVSRQYVDKLIADGRLAAQRKPGSKHRVVRVADVLELEASRRAGADRIGATIDTLVDAGAEF